MPNRMEKLIPGVPSVARDQPRLEWMKVVRNRIVAKVGSRLQNRMVPEGTDMYAFDVPTEHLRPVVFPEQGRLVDFSEWGERRCALCRDGNRLNLLAYRRGVWQSEGLPNSFPDTSSIRIVVHNNLLICFALGGAFTRIGRNWQPFRKLFHWGSIAPVPQCVLCIEKSVYAGYDAGEWRGALFRLDKASPTWTNCASEYLPYPNVAENRKIIKNNWIEEVMIGYLPITGVTQSSDNHVWISSGLAHLGSIDCALDEYDGSCWKRIIPGSVTLPEESDITGIAFMPSGELRIVAGCLGLLELKGYSLHPVLGVNWYELGQSIYTQGLMIDQDGRNFIGTFDAGILLSHMKGDELILQRLTFDSEAPPIHLEELFC